MSSSCWNNSTGCLLSFCFSILWWKVFFLFEVHGGRLGHETCCESMVALALHEHCKNLSTCLHFHDSSTIIFPLNCYWLTRSGQFRLQQRYRYLVCLLWYVSGLNVDAWDYMVHTVHCVQRFPAATHITIWMNVNALCTPHRLHFLHFTMGCAHLLLLWGILL